MPFLNEIFFEHHDSEDISGFTHLKKKDKINKNKNKNCLLETPVVLIFPIYSPLTPFILFAYTCATAKVWQVCVKAISNICQILISFHVCVRMRTLPKSL